MTQNQINIVKALENIEGSLDAIALFLFFIMMIKIFSSKGNGK